MNFMFNAVFSRDVRKNQNSVFKNRTVQKFDILSDGFPIETACNPAFKWSE